MLRALSLWKQQQQLQHSSISDFQYVAGAHVETEDMLGFKQQGSDQQQGSELLAKHALTATGAASNAYRLSQY